MFRITYLICGVIVSSLLTLSQARSAELWVDNVNGADSATGSKAFPVKSFKAALAKLKGSDTLHLVNNPETPYRGIIDIRGKQRAGTATAPTVIDGHGSTLSNLVPFPDEHWEKVEDGLYKFNRQYTNNAWIMDRQGYWSGLPIVRFNRQPGSWVKSLAELKPNTYFLRKGHPKDHGGKYPEWHNTLYIRLPAGETPKTILIEAVGTILFGGQSNCHVGTDYVTVRNLTSLHANADGFSSTHSKGLIFENVHGAFCMDQGISHHGSEVTVINSRFDHNVICGAFDVYPEVKSTYLGCLFEEDTWMGGVQFQRGHFHMKNCVIRSNRGTALAVTKGATAVVENCLIAGGRVGLKVDSGGKLTISNSTISDFHTAVQYGWGKTLSELSMTNCSIHRSIKALFRQDCAVGSPLLKLTLEGNAFEKGKIAINQKTFSVKTVKELNAVLNLKGSNTILHAGFPPEEDCGVDLTALPKAFFGQ